MLSNQFSRHQYIFSVGFTAPAYGPHRAQLVPLLLPSQVHSAFFLSETLGGNNRPFLPHICYKFKETLFPWLCFSGNRGTDTRFLNLHPLLELNMSLHVWEDNLSLFPSFSSFILHIYIMWLLFGPNMQLLWALWFKYSVTLWLLV